MAYKVEGRMSNPADLGRSCSCCGASSFSEANRLVRVEYGHDRGTTWHMNVLQVCQRCAGEIASKLVTMVRI